MRKFISIICILSFVLSLMSFGVSAESNSYTEYFEDGSYVITEFTETSYLARATRSGTTTKTYFNANDKKIVTLELNGTFNYVYGSSATATSATVAVTLHTSDAKYISRNSYCSGASAHGSVTFTYNGTNRTLSTKITCDKYGNLS